MKLWTFALEPRGSFDVAVFGSFAPSVRSVCWDAPKKRIVVGTMGSEIYEFSSDDGTNLHEGPLVQGHCKWELWGLAVRATTCAWEASLWWLHGTMGVGAWGLGGPGCVCAHGGGVEGGGGGGGVRSGACRCGTLHGVLRCRPLAARLGPPACPLPFVAADAVYGMLPVWCGLCCRVRYRTGAP